MSGEPGPDVILLRMRRWPRLRPGYWTAAWAHARRVRRSPLVRGDLGETGRRIAEMRAALDATRRPVPPGPTPTHQPTPDSAPTAVSGPAAGMTGDQRP